MKEEKVLLIVSSDDPLRRKVFAFDFGRDLLHNFSCFTVAATEIEFARKHNVTTAFMPSPFCSFDVVFVHYSNT